MGGLKYCLCKGGKGKEVELARKRRLEILLKGVIPKWGYPSVFVVPRAGLEPARWSPTEGF